MDCIAMCCALSVSMHTRAYILVGLAGLIQWILWVIQWKFVHYPWGACTRNATYTYTPNVTYMYRYIVTLHVFFYAHFKVT